MKPDSRSAHARFDDVAQSYDSVVQRAIGPSGESVQFFADLKVGLMAGALGRRVPKTILDFGCGIGNTTRSLGRTFANSEVVGFDPSQESLALARSVTGAAGAQVRYVSNTDDTLPLPDASVGAAFAACVFHHIAPSEREHWARKLRRILEPGGLFFLFEHNPFNPLTVRVVRNVPFDEGVKLLKPGEVRALLKHCGLSASPARFYFFFPRAVRALRVFEPMLRRIPLGAQFFVVGERQFDSAT